MSPETKKKLLYGGGALASIAALVLYVRSKSPNQPIYPATTGGGSGGGGVSAGTQQNDAAALNAATALAVEQSRAQTAQLQTEAAIRIAGIQAGAQVSAANAKTAQSALGPGGAATAAAPIAAKTLQDLVKGIVDYVRGNPQDQNPAVTDTTNDPFNLVAAANNAQAFVGPREIYGPVPSESSYVSPAIYDINGNVIPGGAIADYYQGSIGGGDSSYFGDNSFVTGGGFDPNAYDPGSQPEVSVGVA